MLGTREMLDLWMDFSHFARQIFASRKLRLHPYVRRHRGKTPLTHPCVRVYFLFRAFFLFKGEWFIENFLKNYFGNGFFHSDFAGLYNRT
jgi:hypothetical protein